MNILLLNYEYPPLGGGAGNATYYLLKEFSNNENINITLITSSTDKEKTENISDNIVIHYLDIGKGSSLHYQSYRELITYAWKAFFFAKKLLKKNKYDLIHAFFGIPCGFVAMLLRLPYLVSLRGSDVPGYSPRMRVLEILFLKKLSKEIWIKSADTCTNSKGLSDLAAKTLNRDYKVIPNGVDTDFFNKGCEKYDKKKAFRIISTGRLITRKGYHHLIEALDDEELVLIGDGPEKENLKNLAKGKNVKFLGEQSRDVIASELRKSDIFILPSSNEGMSNSLLEAMASGLPVIVTDVGGSEELVDGNGFILEECTSINLRNAIKTIKSSQNNLEIMGKQSRKISEKYSWFSTAKEYLYLYNQILSDS